MSTANHIVVEHLVKRFQDKIAVDDVSLEIKQGELLELSISDAETTEQFPPGGMKLTVGRDM